MAREITAATRLVLVCNPNNPRARPCRCEEFAAFLEEVPRHVAVILDEAYCEFSTLQDPDESLELLRGHPNLVLLRTFSKVYGLCGLRVGFGLCGDEAFRLAVDQVRQPFFCNAAAQAAALEALNHQDEVTRRVELTIAERLKMDERLRAMGFEPAESQANFCWFRDRRGRRRRARGRPRPGRPGHPGARRHLARSRGLRARDLRPARGERALPRGARRAPLTRNARRSMTAARL